MRTVLKLKEQKARKTYNCDACYSLYQSGLLEEMGNGGFVSKLTPEEILAIDTSRKHAHKILPGELYVYQFSIEDGEKQTFRAIPAINDICLKYGIYGEDY